MNKKEALGAPIAASEITPKSVFDARRSFIRTMAGGALGAALSSGMSGSAWAQATPPVREPLAGKRNPALSTEEAQTSYRHATTYNNFYEFGTDKSDPEKYAHTLITRPWTVSIEGLVKRPKVYDIESLLKLAPIEERVYRMRCVEGWSMVIPWVGYSLNALIRELEPLGSAKYVEFTSLADKKQMPGIAVPVINWPYLEGLRLDEAMHPLTLLSFGMYGEVLPKQNGAPVRLVVPWKYGFKSPKSIVRIRFVEEMPKTSWMVLAPHEYGFYSNVNPEVAHPRWSQATETRIGEAQESRFSRFLTPKRKTLLFNGYGDQVSSLYAGMDLKKNY